MDKNFKTHLNLITQDKQHIGFILQNMADGIIALDCSGRITLFNKAACRVFGRGEDEMIGVKIEDADIHPEIARMSYDCMTTGDDCSAEIKLPGFPPCIMNIRTTAYRPEGCDSECAIVILHDITEIRRHENNQREFVSNVSHELRTPLTAIRTTAETLLAGAKNDEDVVDRFLNTIISETDRLSVLINDLMEIARKDAGAMRMDKSVVTVKEIVSRALDAVLPMAKQKNIEIKVSVPDDLECYCDESQIVQVMRNLTDNAVKYTQDGGFVDVCASREKDSCKLRVKDSGIGIPHGEIDRIFERFYRVDKARSRRLGGTGLGLAIVKDIVNAHDGEIFVESRLGNGTIFTVMLPAGSI